MGMKVHNLPYGSVITGEILSYVVLLLYLFTEFRYKKNKIPELDFYKIGIHKSLRGL